MKELYQKLRTFTGKSYGLYKSLTGKTWNFGDFDMEFIHVQGDPYAPASRLKFNAPIEILGIPTEWGNSPVKRLALADYLLRRLSAEVETRSEEEKLPIHVLVPGEEVLVRNTLWVGGPSENGGKAVVEVILSVGLPGDKRIIDVPAAVDLLTATIPDLLMALYLNSEAERAEALKYIESLEVREALLAAVQEKGFVAFVPNGAILPRESGTSDFPKKDAVPFEAPKELLQTFEVCGKKISGMAIPKGITIIAGGAYHGKSTLLSALESSAVPHVLGDGREWIVTDPSAMRIAAEPGRIVKGTRIAPFVRQLPFGVSTEKFETRSASGSTSEAANVMEALEFGSKTLYVDEDASAVNFLIRDARMRSLVGEKDEPLIPLSDRAEELKKLGVNMVLVVGACGDYLKVADTVLVMKNYEPMDETAKAKEIAAASSLQAPLEKLPSFGNLKCRPFPALSEDLVGGVKTRTAQERQVKIRLRGTELTIGYITADLRALFPTARTAQLSGLGLFLLNMLQNVEELPTDEAIHKLYVQIQNVGFRRLPQGFSKDSELPREQEIAAALLRFENPPKP